MNFMQANTLINRYIFALLLLNSLFFTGTAQTGSFTASITPQNRAMKTINLSLSKPLFKFDNTHGYWFINPHNGSRHFTLMPPPGYGNSDAVFIDVTDRENDIDIYTGTSNDSDNISFGNILYGITAPEWNVQDKSSNKPLHIHFSTFGNSEIAFTISGTVIITSRKDHGGNEGTGTISGSGHFFREPKFLKSDLLSGCDCDPTIYPTIFDEENNRRSISACEAALNNKLFDAVQRSIARLFSDVAYTGTASPIPPGSIDISMIAGAVDIKVPVKERPYCSSDYYHLGISGIDSYKKIFSNDDRFGLRFIKMVGNEQMGLSANSNAMRQRQAFLMDSVRKLMEAKRISYEEYGKALAYYMSNMNSGMPDLKKLEAESNLYIGVIFNVSDKETALVKLEDKSKVAILHDIKGSSFEIFSPMAKDNDGDWVSNRKNIYFGKFTPPVTGKSGGGFDAETTNPIYPANGNKLTIYNIIIKMEGGKDLMDAAIAHIDFTALQDLISK